MSRSGERGRSPSQLPIEEDETYEQGEWRFAQVLWYALLILMGLTLAGLFGNGPLSSTAMEDATGALRIEYQRFGRLGSALRTTIRIRRPADGQASIDLSRDYLDAVRIVAITPEPDSATTTADGVRYHFSQVAAPAVVTLDFESRHPWRVRGRIASDALSVPISHFIYP
jgi:hypothetical protein